MIVVGVRNDTGQEVVALVIESVEIKKGRKKFWEGDCLHKGIVLSLNCNPNTKPASALAVASRRIHLGPKRPDACKKIQ